MAKVFNYLSLLTSEDQKSFLSYLKSPFLNNSKTLTKYAALLMKTEGLDEKKRDKAIDKAGFQKKEVYNLNYSLKRKIKEFLSYCAFQKSELLQNDCLLNELNQKHASKEVFEDAKEHAERELKEVELSDFLAGTYTLSFQSLKAESRWPRTQASNKLPESLDLLDQHYLLHKLKLLCEAQNQAEIYQLKSWIEAPSELIERLAAQYKELAPGIQFYYLIFRLLTNPDNPTALDEWVDCMKADENTANSLNLRDKYSFGLNILIRRINRSDKHYLSYLELAAQMYESGIRSGALLGVEKLASGHLKNAVSSLCRAGKVHIAKELLHDFKDQLGDNHEGYALIYNEGICALHEKDYVLAIEKMIQVKAGFKQDLFYGLDARIYEWRAYYSHHKNLTPTQFDLLLNYHNALLKYVKSRATISEDRKVRYITYIKLFQRLIHIEVGENQLSSEQKVSEWNEIMQVLLSSENFPNKHWLEFRVQELINEHQSA